MVDQVLFQMWGPFRDGLIASHQFYVSEAKTRLLSQFGTMKEDADRYAEDWLASRAPYFNPDRDDPADAYQQAWDESVSFYLQLEDLQKATRLSVIAGMYHEWEKQLRDWITRELGRVIHGSHTRAVFWKATIDQLFDFLECWGWPVRSRPYGHVRQGGVISVVAGAHRHAALAVMCRGWFSSSIMGWASSVKPSICM